MYRNFIFLFAQQQFRPTVGIYLRLLQRRNEFILFLSPPDVAPYTDRAPLDLYLKPIPFIPNRCTNKLMADWVLTDLYI